MYTFKDFIKQGKTPAPLTSYLPILKLSKLDVIYIYMIILTGSNFYLCCVFLWFCFIIYVQSFSFQYGRYFAGHYWYYYPHIHRYKLLQYIFNLLFSWLFSFSVSLVYLSHQGKPVAMRKTLLYLLFQENFMLSTDCKEFYSKDHIIALV